MNNPNLYNAVLVGAASGMLTRWITAENSGSYSNVLAVVQAIATEIDSQIAPAFINEAQCTLMQSLVQSVFNDRYPQVVTATTYQAVGRAIVAAYTQLTAGLAQNAVRITYSNMNTAIYTSARLLMAAGHTPGIYLVSRWVNQRVAAGAGNFSENITCDGPSGVNTAAGWGSFATTSIRQLGAQSLAMIASLGTAAMTTAGTNAGVTGDYLLDATYTMSWVSPIPT